MAKTMAKMKQPLNLTKVDWHDWRAEQEKAMRKIAREILQMKKARGSVDVFAFSEVGSDRDDFHELHVSAIRDALQAAYTAGYVSGRADAQERAK